MTPHAGPGLPLGIDGRQGRLFDDDTTTPDGDVGYRGPTACKALYRCTACLEPFEHVKEI